MKMEKMDELSEDWSILSRFRNEIFGASIILIIIYHFFENVEISNLQGIIKKMASAYNGLIGSIGVDIFLFLSGMGLYFSFKKNNDIKQFYSRRFKRILVPYIIWGSIYWVVKDIVILKLGVDRLLFDFTLLSFWFEGNRNLWFIAFIMLMYVIFPYVYNYFYGDNVNNELKNRRFVLSLAIYFIMTILLKLSVPSLMQNIGIAVYRFPVFVTGIFFAEYIFDKRRFTESTRRLVICGFLIKITSVLLILFRIPITRFIPEPYINLLYSISLMIMLAYLFKMVDSEIVHRVAIFFGGLSLELYMTHVNIRRVMNMAKRPTYSKKNYLVCIFLAIILSIMLKNTSDKVIEKIDNRVKE